MKKIGIVVVILIILAGGAYLGRHKLKTLFMGSSQAPAAPQVTSALVSPTIAVMSDNIYLVKMDASKGKYLTDFAGMTLYTFDKDTAGVSNCTGGCAKAWPPYTSGATAQKTFPANIAVMTRADGTKQFTWKGMPLYYYASDAKPGDITGDGVGGVWHIVTP